MELTRIEGRFCNGGNLPKFLLADEVSSKLCAKGIIIKPREVLELATAGKLPAFYFDGDRDNPVFLWKDIQVWIKDNMLWHSVGAPISIQIVSRGHNPPLSKNNLPVALCSIEHLFEHSLGPVPVVYFLCRHGAVVYVGQSTHLSGRLHGHADKNFDRIFYLLVPQSQLDRIEREFIELLTPEYNRQHVVNRQREEAVKA